MTTLDSRRQRKSQSKERLIESAEALFNEYGYEDTTLEAIAEHAGLHVQTLYRHFPSKSDLAFALLFENLRQFEEYFHARKKDALHAWRDWVELNAKVALKRKIAIATQSAPVRVSSKYLEYWHQYEVVLAEGIADDMGVDSASDMRPMLIACMLVGANKHMAAELARAGKSADKGYLKTLLSVVDTVIDEFSPILRPTKPRKKAASR